MQGRSILLGQAYEHRVPTVVVAFSHEALRSFVDRRGASHTLRKESFDENGRDSLSIVLGAAWLYRACPAGCPAAGHC
jgi:hypothetical protein